MRRVEVLVLEVKALMGKVTRRVKERALAQQCEGARRNEQSKPNIQYE